METQTFEEQILIEHNSRIQRESWERHLKEVRGEYIYLDFCVWCNCQGKIELKNNAIAFAEWLKKQGITLTEYQRRYLAEKYFGWMFVWNEEKQLWEGKQ